MDDPIFDPWGNESGDPDSPAPRPVAPKWRSRAGPVAPPSAKESPSRTTAGVIRDVVAPRLGFLAQRLRVARHSAVVEDLLNREPSMIRLAVRLWAEPLESPSERVSGLLELSVTDAPDREIVVRVSFGSMETAREEARLPLQDVRATWVDAIGLRFVQGLMARA